MKQRTKYENMLNVQQHYCELHWFVSGSQYTYTHAEVSCVENNSLRSHLGLLLESIFPRNIFTAMLLSHILHAGPIILPHQLDLDVVEIFCFLSQNQVFVL
jgi:hypothetical protein